MTIDNTYLPVEVSGDDATLDFSFTFKIYEDTDLLVYKEVKTTAVQTLMVLGVDYSVTINPIAEGGTITFVIGSVPLTTEWVQMYSNIPYTQDVDIPTDGNLREVALEGGMDRTVRQIQQLNYDGSKKLGLPTGYEGLDLPEGSGGAYVGWNATGDALVNKSNVGATGPTGPSGGPVGLTGPTGPTGPTGAAGLGSHTTIQVILGNGIDIIAAGIFGDVQVPFAGTITGVTLLADTATTAVIDIWKDTYANFPPTVADTITAAAIPTLTAANKSTDTTLTGWTTAVADGDVFRFNIDSNDLATRITLNLEITRST